MTKPVFAGKGDKMLKKTIAAVLAALMVLTLAACASQGEPEPVSEDYSDALKKVTLALDWTPNTNHTGIYVALAKGYFEEEGLDVTVVQPPDAGSASLVASGKAEFGIDAQDTMANAITGSEKLPITAIAAMMQHNTSGIISRKEDGITSPKGMAGHNYATWEMPIEQAMLKKLVTDDGGDFSQVELIPALVTDEATGLSTKQVDTIWVFWGWAGIACEQAGVDVNYWDFASLDDTFDYYTPVLIANNEFLAGNADTAKAFLRALSKGYQDAVNDPEGSAYALMEANPELQDSEELVMASQKYLANYYIADGKPWGYIDPARWNKFYKWIDDNGLAEEKLGENAGFSNDYLPE